MTASQPCPCGLDSSYSTCCGRFIDQGIPAPDPEALMRSRYTAFVLRKYPYLIKTWHPKTCPNLQPSDLEGTQWQGLAVVRSQAGFKKGYVEFRARYVDKGKEQELHEISRFQKIKNRWHYQDELQEWPGD